MKTIPFTLAEFLSPFMEYLECFLSRHRQQKVIYSATHWLHTWIVLQKHGARDMVLATCRRLEQVLRECFFQAYGWRSSLRIGYN
jgi:hypothetical protein